MNRKVKILAVKALFVLGGTLMVGFVLAILVALLKLIHIAFLWVFGSWLWSPSFPVFLLLWSGLCVICALFTKTKEGRLTMRGTE